MLERWASKRSREVAASTYNKERDLIEAVLEYARRNGLVLYNSATHLIHSKQSKRIVRIPTCQEFSKMLTQIRKLDVRSIHAAILVELLAYSGMRLAEASALRWEDVGFAKDRFIVTGGADGPKNRRQRVVPLFPALRTVLERVRAERDPAATETISEIESARRRFQSHSRMDRPPGRRDPRRPNLRSPSRCAFVRDCDADDLHLTRDISCVNEPFLRIPSQEFRGLSLLCSRSALPVPLCSRS